MNRDPRKVAVIGFGAMARSLEQSLRKAGSDIAVTAALISKATDVEHDGVVFFRDVDGLVAWGPSVVVECASHEAVKDHVPALLRAGVDVIVVSIGSLGDATLLNSLDMAAEHGNSRLTVVSGAVGGLDALRSAKLGGLDRVMYTGTKPPAAWKGTPAEKFYDLSSLTEPTVIFKGNAREASALYPKNANVTAAVALAGVGFDETAVTLVADPAADGNSHRVSAVGSFGSFDIVLRNKPLPDNPKTSWLAALSVEQALHRHFQRIEL